MSSDISIILTKANWCPHCQNFEPIYEEAKKIYENHEGLKNYKIKFENYDLADENEKNIFSLNHFDIVDKIKGYPTVYLKLKNSENNNLNEYLQITHTVIDDKINKQKQNEDAAKRFLNNIVNNLKTLNSNGKMTYLQNGGDNIWKLNDKYKNKYLKYKMKYLKLKKN